MHEVDVPAAAITLSALPTLGICAQHGHPATGSRIRGFGTRTRPWTLELAGTVVSLRLREPVRGPLPVCQACVNSRRAFLGSVALGWAVAVVLGGVAVGTASTALLVTASVVLLVVVVATFSGDTFRTSGALSPDQAWVRLRRVHPAFADAVRARVADATMPPSYLHAG